MKYIASIPMLVLFASSSVHAEASDAYYDYEILAVETDGNYGPFASSISEDGSLFSAFALKAQLTQDTDIGLPYTFNRRCFYDDDVCELQFYGSENTSDLSYENAYQDWRNAMSDMNTGNLTPESYFLTASSNADTVTISDGFGADTDVKITDVVVSDAGSFLVGYGSDPYVDDEREFVRRGFVMDASGTEDPIQLLPADFEDEDEDDYGGFTSAYKMRDVVYTDEDTLEEISKTLIIGHSSQSFAAGDDTYFDYCYSSDETNYRYTLNDLVYCPGFDTQAWAWEYIEGSTELEGFTLATEWLDDNTDNGSTDATYSAAALDINNVGIAVGLSTFEYYDGEEGGRQRAIIMNPSVEDEVVTYAEPFELTDATSGVSDQDDAIHNTWAQTITDYIADEDNDEGALSNVIMGNREYAYVKSRNKPSEMFIYDYDMEEETGDVSFPLLNKKVQSTKQRLAGDSSTKSGANSYGYDMNNFGLVVGKADAYDQTDPVYDGSPRTQSAFLYDHVSGDSWFLDDLICSEDADGNVYQTNFESDGYIRLISATAINDDGTILASGYQYATEDDYKYWLDATPILVKLTLSATADTDTGPDSSPNCWDSDLLTTVEEDYVRQGAASFWLWLFALPLLMLRRFIK